jgi:diguanylate cyclase (GGDEF)-like protein/PAS domain S-box-containing protein
MHGPEGEIIGVVHVARDVSDQKRAQAALREAEETYRNIFEHAVEGIFQARPGGPFIKANPAMAKMLGFSGPEALLNPQRTAEDFLCVDAEACEAFRNILRRDGQVANHEMQGRRRDGGRIWLSVSARAINDASGALERVEGLAEDITERKLTEQQLQHRATFDELTDVPNRFLFLEHSRRMLAQARRLGTSLALLYIDLDDFKIVNDTYGHHVGDKVLGKAAARLRERVRSADILARIGGDEFTVLLGDLENRQAADKVAREIIDSLTRPYAVGGLECRIGVSIGVSFFPQDGESVEELLKQADAAMYRAKDQGGNVSCAYESGCDFPDRGDS